MKKFILGLILGAIVFVPITAIAGVVHTPDHANREVYLIGDTTSVDIFDDQNNKCYVAYTNTSSNDENVAISCVRN